ncbi:hypothetical protein [Chryseobacterium sp. SIMBA_038]|uniref:hypothetical protein n=1 Tax=Chryseobacterium sp. SIMBA_038 TaxID=3085780 RepID=UPI003979BA2D
MKNLVFAILTFLVFLSACSKQEPASFDTNQEVKVHYDTVAVDSFSAGATSVDIVRQIRMSSQKYQDSVKEAIKLQAEEKRIKDELDKENKKKQDDEKKTDEEKKKNAAETPSTPTKTE